MLPLGIKKGHFNEVTFFTIKCITILAHHEQPFQLSQQQEQQL